MAFNFIGDLDQEQTDQACDLANTITEAFVTWLQSKGTPQMDGRMIIAGLSNFSSHIVNGLCMGDPDFLEQYRSAYVASFNMQCALWREQDERRTAAGNV